MKRPGGLLFTFVATALMWGCYPYDKKFKGEFNAGAVNPVNFPPPYRGTTGDRNVSGSGTPIAEKQAFIAGAVKGYFLFPFSPSQATTPNYNPVGSPATTGIDPRRVATTASRAQAPRFPVIPSDLGYAFDPSPPTSPFPATGQCQKPSSDYVFDPVSEDVSRAEQGNIFVNLPTATYGQGSLPTWTYAPIIKEVNVHSAGEPCQDIKSFATLLTRGDVSFSKDPELPGGIINGTFDGNYLAWAIIDPGLGVYRLGQTPANSTGVGTQKWGWFQHFLMAYIDGGYIPTVQVTETSAPPNPVSAVNTRMVTQRLLVPRANVGAAPGTPGQIGAGYDVLEAVRGGNGYSPVCEVVTYDPGVPTMPAALPRDAATIDTLYGATEQNGSISTGSGSFGAGSITYPRFVFCLQAQ